MKVQRSNKAILLSLASLFIKGEYSVAAEHERLSKIYGSYHLEKKFKSFLHTILTATEVTEPLLFKEASTFSYQLCHLNPSLGF